MTGHYGDTLSITVHLMLARLGGHEVSRKICDREAESALSLNLNECKYCEIISLEAIVYPTCRVPSNGLAYEWLCILDPMRDRILLESGC